MSELSAWSLYRKCCQCLDSDIQHSYPLMGLEHVYGKVDIAMCMWICTQWHVRHFACAYACVRVVIITYRLPLVNIYIYTQIYRKSRGEYSTPKHTIRKYVFVRSSLSIVFEQFAFVNLTSQSMPSENMCLHMCPYGVSLN